MISVCISLLAYMGTQSTAMIDMLTPCVRMCGVNDEGRCQGCGRTEQQLREWRYYSDDQKRSIITRLTQQQQNQRRQ